MPRVVLALALAGISAVGAGCSRRDTPKNEVVGAPTSSPSARPAAPASPPEPPVGPPRGYRLMTVGGVADTAHGNALVLTDTDETVGVLIFVGGTEALSLGLRLKRRRYARPLTHDLLDSVMRELGGEVQSARVDRVEHSVFHGTLVVQTEGRRAEIDARPSDALAIAVGASAPIYVSEQVIESAGIDLKKLDVRPPESFDPESPPGEAPGIEL